MTRRASLRAWLGAALAAAALGAVALVAVPGQDAFPPAPGPGQPLGAATPAPPVDEADKSRTEAVSDLLDRRAAAIRDRDEKAFLATIDPAADKVFRYNQQRLFQNLANVPFSAWTYELRPDDTVDVDDLPDEDAARADELWAPAVDLRYALRGGDVTATSRAMGYLFARHDGAWYLRSDKALEKLGRRTWRGPWDFAPCQVTATRHGIVLSHPGNDQMVERLVRELDPSVRAVGDVWPTSWSRRVVLMLPDSVGEMKELVGPNFPVQSVVAVAVADRVDNASRTVTGQRVVLSPDGVRALSIPSLRVVLRHEITHLAARADTVDGSPIWLLEGFADYVGYRDSDVTLEEGAPDLARQVREDGLPTSLPEDRAFRASGSELDQAYQQSWTLARFVADRYGEDTLVELYRKLAAVGPASARRTDDLLRDVLGMDRARLVSDWQDYLRDALK
ncbi:MAG: basic secretory protein-like protein [Actinophytocola sp.]|uniref:basic secretory protein-like protein n=1 Tax=Actinophytocola sp. TaxID=1872138 RepID=UPI003D6AB310